MDQAKARREARIRKILENSEKRLQKITGVENKSTKTQIEGINHFQSHEKESDSSISLDSYADNFELPNRSDKYNKTDNLETTCNSSLLSENTQLNSLNENQLESSQHNSNRNALIVALPFIWSILIVVCNILQINITKLYIDKIFLPLIAFEIQDFYFSPNLSNVKSKLLSVMILLTGKMYSRRKFNFILYIVKILQDIMVYFFIFIASQIFIKSIFKLQSDL